jgi:hypothetical protein
LLIALKDGEISDPVDESDGVHLIAMIKRRLPVSSDFRASEQSRLEPMSSAKPRPRCARPILSICTDRADIVVAPEYAQ